MPRGPIGEKRPSEPIACAVMVAKIATNEIEDTGYEQPNRLKGGKAGGEARAKLLSPERRQEIARKGGKSRWKVPVEAEAE